MPQTSYAYSFSDVTGSIQGPGGSADIVNTGIANEGISVEFNERVSTTYGAAGAWMHTLHAAKGGKITIRVMKNGALNAILSRMYNFDTSSAANVGKNTISIRIPTVGDWFVGVGCTFTKFPNVVYANEGPMLEWVFTAGNLDGSLGNGAPSII